MIAVIETHILGNFIYNMVFGDHRVSTKNEDGEQHSVQYFEKCIHITGKPYTHRYIGHVLLNKTLESCALFTVQKCNEIAIPNGPPLLLTLCTSYVLYMELLKNMFSNFMQISFHNCLKIGMCTGNERHCYPTLAREFQGFRVWGKFVFRMLELTDTPTNLANQVKVGHAHDQSRSVQSRRPERAHQNNEPSWRSSKADRRLPRQFWDD